VIAIAPPDKYSSDVAALGCHYMPLRMNNKGKNPIEELGLVARLTRLFRHEQLSCVLTFTPKPNIYGCWAARALRIPAIANVAGLGSVFTVPSLTQRLVKTMYRVAFRWPEKVFFQNATDLALMTSLDIVAKGKAELLPGSGVDVEYFCPRPAENRQGFVFLLLGRLLREKGVDVYVEAARELRKARPNAVFNILGFVDVENPSAISSQDIRSWAAEGVITYLGDTKDVRPFIADADCIVLPSYYREGVPRSLLEAASMGKPIITTDMPGCRNVVENGTTGFLVRPRDIAGLVNAMERMVKALPQYRREMGHRAREKVCREFSERHVLDRYRASIRAALKGVKA